MVITPTTAKINRDDIKYDMNDIIHVIFDIIHVLFDIIHDLFDIIHVLFDIIHVIFDVIHDLFDIIRGIFPSYLHTFWHEAQLPRLQNTIELHFYLHLNRNLQLNKQRIDSKSLTMKKIQLLLSLLCFSLITKAQNTDYPKPQLSAATKQYLWEMEKHQTNEQGALPEYVYKHDAQNNIYVSALIKVQPGFNAAALAPLGVHIGTKAGNIWTAQVPLNSVRDFTQLRGIKNIDMDQPSYPALDSARKATRVDSVHGGYGLPQAYSGANVVVGIVDAGFDYTHPAFFDTALTSYRIKRVWEEKNTTGTAPAAFMYGSEFTDSASIFTKGNDIVTGTHGTHVSGIAAGSGIGSTNDKRFRGVAYSSDIVMVGMYPSAAYWLNTGMTDMLDGINYVFNYASSVSKPAVVNLSWGCPLGPHDGRSLFSQACNNLTGAGKIFVLSGGNNGGNNIHLSKTFTATDTLVKTVCTFSTYLTDKRNWVDIWGDSSKTFCVQLNLYNATTKIDSTMYVCLDDTTHQFNLIGSNGDTCFVTLTTVASEFNDKPHTLINLYSRVGTDKLSITVKANDGQINMWQGYVLQNSGYYGAFVTGSLAGHVNGNSLMTISDMVTTQSAIGVAAYNSKPSFTDINGTGWSYTGYTKGAISAFSSKGPTADGRSKPNIAGPGLALASSISSFDTTYAPGGSNYTDVVSNFVSPINSQTYEYAMAAGTSMSGPTVSGIVALLLEANPALTPQDVMTTLYQTAIKDNFTGVINMTTGSNTWGWGKVNAYRAMIDVLGIAGVYSYAGENLDCQLFPNPGNGLFTVSYNSIQNRNLKLEVFNTIGSLISSEKWQVTEGVNLHPLDLTNMPVGIYLVRVSSPDGFVTIKTVVE